jgi:hypothetical protein
MTVNRVLCPQPFVYFRFSIIKYLNKKILYKDDGNKRLQRYTILDKCYMIYVFHCDYTVKKMNDTDPRSDPEK